ncbi:hypothetical protein NWE55_03285 [Myroides albus]|uniref:Uncharacterized protein n=1 Tax=Myroides albus TaxID=2562892 RepID=A0A6I3LJP0_9FLAO|nr:hypothetical protein [Myroides albus]MTG98024.1 hypothetical protein [Myroides albus]UVD80316.1 hypothetical protein NWE55_03285 [Myroides albus]
MGWFTKKENSWEIKHSWLAILSLFFPFVFPPLGMLYMGIVGKIRSLLYGSFLWMALYTGVYFFYFFIGNTTFFKLLSFCVFLGGAVVVSMYLRVFLQRLHLRYIINLEWSKKYDYKDFIRRKNISEILSVSTFIDSLTKWQTVVKNAEVRGYIAKMILLVKKITSQNDQFVSELFLERHAYSIENILQQYYQIELSKIENDVIKEAEEKLRFTIGQASQAFENELTGKMKFQNMSIEAESSAYLEDMKTRGLL